MSQVVGETRSTVLSPIDLRMIAAGLVSLIVVIGLSLALSDQTGEMLTRNTVRLSLTWYTAALCLMMRLDAGDWRATTTLGRLARWCWTWGILCFLVHLGMAFHFYHGWSHANAFAHTAEVSGTGEGIYVSYLFTVLWIVDALWWWAQPATFAGRTPWIDRALHAFMLFIVFNGTVIYERGSIRWAGLLMFIGLAVAWVQARRARSLARR